MPIDNDGNGIIRLMTILECKTQSELAGLLGISRSTVTEALNRQSLPAEWLLTALGKYNINPYFITGDSTQPFLDPMAVNDTVQKRTT